MINFHVGQKVVCIGDDWCKADDYPAVIFPVKGSVYTVRDIDIDRYDGEAYLRFVEIVNLAYRYRYYFGETVFHHEAFRPVVTRKTDISIFTDILNTQRMRTDA